MPRTFRQVIEEGINRVQFIQEMERLAPRRKPKRTKAEPTGTLFAIRNKRLSVQEAALRHVQVVITYIKETTGEQKKYIVAPYSYRYRMLKSGFRKMLFAYDMEDRRIKGFVLRNIRNVALTDRKFTPMWLVEF